MDYGMWEPFYRKILADFGFSQDEDEAVASELDRLLGGRRAGDAELRALLEGKEVTVAGNGPNVVAEMPRARGVLVTADEATSVALAQGLRPAVLVTDLDGDVAGQVGANLEGTMGGARGRGENGLAAGKGAPDSRGSTVATPQSRPVGGLVNFGGFTDGDRAAFLADHFGAKAVHLVGFHFQNSNAKG